MRAQARPSPAYRKDGHRRRQRVATGVAVETGLLNRSDVALTLPADRSSGPTTSRAPAVA